MEIKRNDDNLLLYASVKKTDKNTSNNLNNEYAFSLGQKKNEKEEESIKWEKTLYQKYEKWLPEKYFASGEIGVCDLNQDGQDDYVAVVYQEKLISDHDEIWLFLSNAEGEYDKWNNRV